MTWPKTRSLELHGNSLNRVPGSGFFVAGLDVLVSDQTIWHYELIVFNAVKFLFAIARLRTAVHRELHTPRRGFIQAVFLILRLEEGGLAAAGPPCSSFVYLNRASSGRSKQKPFGNPRRSYIVQSNKYLDNKNMFSLDFDR